MKINQEKVPVNEQTEKFITKAPASEEEDLIREAMQEVLSEYASLPSKIQTDILEDVKNQKKLGAKFKEISDRLNVLIKKGKDLDSMTSEDSDKVYNPKPSPEEVKLADEEEEIIEALDIDDLIKKLEEMKYKGEEDEGDGKDDKPKEWIN